MKILTALSIIFFLCVFNANAASPTQPDVTLVESDGTRYPFFPSIAKLPSGELVMVYYWHTDHVNTKFGRIYLKKSNDNGLTWSKEILVADYSDIGLDSRDPSIAVLSNGDLVVNFFTGTNDGKKLIQTKHQPHTLDTRFTKSKDGGLTWSTPIIIPTKKYWNATSGPIIQLANGDLLVPVYGQIKEGDKGDASAVIRSSDLGTTWGSESIIASDLVTPEEFNEMALGELDNGEIYAATREPGKIFRSIDNGYSWRLFDDTKQPMHASPDLLKIDNERFFLTWGTMDNTSGNRIVYGKMYYPKKGWNYTPTKVIYNPDCKSTWDMAYPSSTLTANNKILTIFYDHGCKNSILGSYSNPNDWETEQNITFEDDKPGQSPSGFTIVGGEAAVSNTKSASGKNSLELNDTSYSVLTSVVKETNATPTKTFEFKVFPVAIKNGICFSLLSGGNSNNNLIFHFMISHEGKLMWHNGTSWIEDLTHGGKAIFNQWNTIKINAYSLTSANIYLNGEYSGMAHNCRSGFYSMDRVRFTSGATAGIGEHFFIDDILISEISNKDISTFEDDQSGQLPSGFTVVGGEALVSSIKSAGGKNSLELRDTSSSVLTSVVKQTNATPTKTFEFKVFPVAIKNGICFSLLSGGNSNNNLIFHFMISHEGKLMWHNGTSWISDLTNGGNVTFNQWNTIKINAYSLTSANIYLNGEYYGMAHNCHSGFSSIDRVRFTSGATAGVGEHFFIDDISINEMSNKDISNFEDNQAGQLPSAFTIVGGEAIISSAKSVSGKNSLELRDTSFSVLTSVVKETTATPTKTFEFKIFPVAIKNGICFSLLSGGNSNNNLIFHFIISHEGKLMWHNGTSWISDLTHGGKVIFNQWNTIKVNAYSLVLSDVYLNGVYAGTAKNGRSGFSTMDRVRFTSGATAGIGEHFFVDDVSVSAFDDHKE